MAEVSRDRAAGEKNSKVEGFLERESVVSINTGCAASGVLSIGKLYVCAYEYQNTLNNE